MKLVEITGAEERILLSLKKLTYRLGFPPTIREIMANLGMNSPQSVRRHLLTLREKGIIKWLERKSRSLQVKTNAEVMKKSKICSACGKYK